WATAGPGQAPAHDHPTRASQDREHHAGRPQCLARACAGSGVPWRARALRGRGAVERRPQSDAAVQRAGYPLRGGPGDLAHLAARGLEALRMRARSTWGQSLVLVGPALLLLVAIYLYPIARLLVLSLA